MRKLTALLVLNWILLAVTVVSAPLPSKADALRDFCATHGGEIVTQWTCPTSGVKREDRFCRLLSATGVPMVVNGCTGGSGEFSDLLFESCVLHDLCYHHEPNSNGKSKAHCDSAFYRNSMAICKNIQDQEYRERCEGTAGAFYMAVRMFGKNSWQCSKERTAYPNRLRDIKFRPTKR